MKTAYTKPDGLSPEEQRLLFMFRRTDKEGRRSVMCMARVQVRMAIEFAPKGQTHIRLVKGGES